MYVVREVLHCRPGKIQDLAGRFKKLSGVMQQMGLKPIRLLTDFSGEQFWTLIVEIEAPGLNEFIEMENAVMTNPDARQAVGGYHDLVENGRREIYRVES